MTTQERNLKIKAAWIERSNALMLGKGKKADDACLNWLVGVCVGFELAGQEGAPTGLVFLVSVRGQRALLECGEA